ncbi:MAG: amidohydrolase family protein, partial [Planctomycetales bacterium]
PAPGRVIENGTIVFRDGIVIAVGKDVKIPPDAAVRNLKGKFIYPGLFDAYSEPTDGAADSDSDDDHDHQHESAKPTEGGARHWNPNIVPQFNAADAYRPNAKQAEKLRGQGITVQLIAPQKGIIKGTSVLVASADGDARQTVLRRDVAMHAKLMPDRTRRRGRVYPNSPMGAVALFRQTVLDARWRQAALKYCDQNPKTPRPDRDDALDALNEHWESKRPLIIDAPDELYFLRADRLGREFGLDVAVCGSGREYRRLREIQQSGRAVILPLNFVKPPQVDAPEEVRDVTLERLMDWRLAPENPARLANANIRIAFTSQGLKKTDEFLKAVRKAVSRGLQPKDALQALTTEPAKLFGVSDRLGTLEPGKLAHLVVTDEKLFEKESKVLEVWIDGKRYPTSPQAVADVRGAWSL